MRIQALNFFSMPKNTNAYDNVSNRGCFNLSADSNVLSISSLNNVSPSFTGELIVGSQLAAYVRKHRVKSDLPNFDFLRKLRFAIAKYTHETYKMTVEIHNPNVDPKAKEVYLSYNARQGRPLFGIENLRITHEFDGQYGLPIAVRKGPMPQVKKSNFFHDAQLADEEPKYVIRYYFQNIRAKIYDGYDSAGFTYDEFAYLLGKDVLPGVKREIRHPE